jgi:hypothetical protein
MFWKPVSPKVYAIPSVNGTDLGLESNLVNRGISELEPQGTSICTSATNDELSSPALGRPM